MTSAGEHTQSEDFDAELDQLISDYAAKLPREIGNIAKLLNHAQEAGTDEALEPAKNLVHRLKGTAGSYGFQSISHELEQLEGVIKEGTECGVLQWFRIAAIVTSLEALAEKEAKRRKN